MIYEHCTLLVSHGLNLLHVNLLLLKFYTLPRKTKSSQISQPEVGFRVYSVIAAVLPLASWYFAQQLNPVERVITELQHLHHMLYLISHLSKQNMWCNFHLRNMAHQH